MIVYLGKWIGVRCLTTLGVNDFSTVLKVGSHVEIRISDNQNLIGSYVFDVIFRLMSGFVTHAYIIVPDMATKKRLQDIYHLIHLQLIADRSLLPI